MNVNILARVLIITVVLIGIINQPYWYYSFLRVTVSIVSLILTILAFKKVNKTGFEYLYVAITFLYNPIIPITATKETWVILNVLTIIAVGISLALDKGESEIDKSINKISPQQKENNNTSQQKNPKQEMKWYYYFIFAITILVIFIYFGRFQLGSPTEPEYSFYYEDEYYNDEVLYEDDDGMNQSNYELFENQTSNEYEDSQTNTYIDTTEIIESQNNKVDYYEINQIEDTPSSTSKINEDGIVATTDGGYFTLGSTQNEVKKIMGTPITIYDSLNTWSYEASSVDFNNEGKVIGWSDHSNTLKVKLDKTMESNTFTLGSSKQDVINAMGTPTTIYASLNSWSYEASSVDFNNEGKVIGWSDHSNTLKVKMDKTVESNAFSLGSTKQDVINAMGTPTTIYSSLNFWSYGASSVDFNNEGKVIGWSDFSSILRVK